MIFASFLAEGLLRDLEILAAENNCVLWMRNAEYNQQLYLSSNYWTIWERDPISLYRDPSAWRETVHADDPVAFNEQLIKIRNLINEAYTVTYSIKLKNGLFKWVEDRRIQLPIEHDKKIIIGCALAVDVQEDLDQKQNEISDKIDLTMTHYFRILSHSAPNGTEKITLKDSDLLKKLSKREMQVLKLFLQGYTMAQVAEAIHLSPRTIEGYLQSLKNKLNCESKSEMIMKALERNWLAINL